MLVTEVTEGTKSIVYVACGGPSRNRRQGRDDETGNQLGRGRLLVGCLTSQQHVGVSQGRTCSDNFTCCHTETEVADQTFHLTQSQYTDIGPTSPSTDPITPGAWQGSHWSANFEVTRPEKIPPQAGFEPLIFRSRSGRLNN